jgi:glycosyltransferase involved in cell wall biosynthesis
LQRLACAVACTPVASGHAEARDMQRLMRREAFTLYPAVDAEFFNVEPVAEAEPLVVAMGRGRKDSGDAWFGELAARFLFAGEKARFVWIGGCEPAVQERLQAAGVTVTGWLPDADVCALLARARVYVQASRWRKTPRSLLQAMASGVPCVALDVAAHREVLRHGDTGMLSGDVSDMAFQVKNLLDDVSLGWHMGAAARREASARFALPRLRQSLLALYGLDGGHRVPMPSRTWQVA